MDEALAKAVLDLDCLARRIRKTAEDGCPEELHCLAKAAGAAAFDVCHFACCCMQRRPEAGAARK